MQTEYVACYLCNSDQAEPWAKENSYQVVKCMNCGLVYLNPRPILSDIEESSCTGMHRAEKGTMNYAGLYSARKVADFALKLSELFPDEELSSQPCRWLDIGAGYGEFIQAVTRLSALNSELLGIEHCEPKVKKAKSLGIPVTATPLSDVQGQYTHISLINVFSHLPNPIEFLAEIKPLMASKCQLVLVTGNGGDLPRQEYVGSLYLPDHLSFAGEDHLKVILEKSGVEIKTINRYRDGGSIDNYFIGFLKNIARRAVGRPVVPLRVSEHSRFCSLWIRAELGT